MAKFVVKSGIILLLMAMSALAQTRQIPAIAPVSSVERPAAITGGTVKFEETFADANAWQQWTIVNQDGSTNSRGPTVGRFVSGLSFPNNTSVAPHVAGTFFWASNFSNANGNLMDEWLISPQLPMVEAGDTLRFYGGAPDKIFKDSIEVRIATSDPNGGTAAFEHRLRRFKMDGPTGSWTEYKVPLDSNIFIGAPVWLALRYWHSNGGPFGNSTDNVWIDHIIVTNGNTTTSVSQNFNSGWSLIGLPLAVADSSVNALYPTHTPGSLFSYNGAYRSETHLARRKGFWLNFPQPASETITGQPLNSVTITLVAGWNIISGPTCDVPVSAISDPGNIIVPNTIFGFNGAYFNAQTLEAGKGYWIRASAGGQISISCAP